MILRKYRSDDCKQLAELFYDTVHNVCKGDYTQAQLNAWADGNIDIDEWNNSFLSHFTVVAECDGIAVGFGDIESTGYLDRLYVHHLYQRMGIATVICDELENFVGGKVVTTHASITAKGFFEKRRYNVINEQVVVRNGVALINYVMEKPALYLSN